MIDNKNTPAKIWFRSLNRYELTKVCIKYKFKEGQALTDEQIEAIFLSEHPEQVMDFKKIKQDSEDLQALVNAEMQEQAIKEESQDNSKEGFTEDVWRYCGQDRGGCICGQIWSTKLDFNIATCHMENEDIGEISKEQMLTHARLISAAPDMYRALKDLHLACMMDSDIPIAWWQKHKETVANAKDILNRIDNK